MTAQTNDVEETAMSKSSVKASDSKPLDAKGLDRRRLFMMGGSAVAAMDSDELVGEAGARAYRALLD